MNLAEEPQANREPAPNALEAMIHRPDVVRGLADVLDRHARRNVVLEEQEVGERRLSAFDLRRQDRFLPDVRVQELIWIGQQQRDSIQTTKRLISEIEQCLHLRVDRECRHGRKWARIEGVIRLPADRGTTEGAGAITAARRRSFATRHCYGMLSILRMIRAYLR